MSGLRRLAGRLGVSSAHRSLAERTFHTRVANTDDRLFKSRNVPYHYASSAANVGNNTDIGVGAVIAPGVQIGANCRIHANAVLGEDVVVGDDCHIGAGCSLANCTMGNRVVLQPGVRIGQDGFGFVPTANGNQKKPQLRRVLIEDDVELGANCTVDRGSHRHTVIGEGTKLDNMVHVAHNVRIGKHCLIAAQCGVAGSVTIGDRVHMGGQTGVAQHLSIGDGARIAGKSGVMQSLEGGKEYGGIPAVPLTLWKRQVIRIKQLIQRQTPEPTTL
eukprot:GILK01005666.1.p1 GENE.GILK01005666.1~~GILK01005666.1.p1  ORF type:complete len:274 (-),score=11.35 GILK01005666.1:318-1139(-)